MPNPTTWREVTGEEYTAEMNRQSAARPNDSPSCMNQLPEETIVLWWNTREPFGKTREVDGVTLFYLAGGESDEQG